MKYIAKRQPRLESTKSEKLWSNSGEMTNDNGKRGNTSSEKLPDLK